MAKVLTCDHESVEFLKNLIEKASESSVANEYRDEAEKLQHKMNGNIKAREIL